MSIKQHVRWHVFAVLAGFAAGCAVAAVAVLGFGAPAGIVGLYAVASGATAAICALERERRKRARA
jgi:hypothetical protein